MNKKLRVVWGLILCLCSVTVFSLPLEKELEKANRNARNLSFKEEVIYSNAYANDEILKYIGDIFKHDADYKIFRMNYEGFLTYRVSYSSINWEAYHQLVSTSNEWTRFQKGAFKKMYGELEIIIYPEMKDQGKQYLMITANELCAKKGFMKQVRPWAEKAGF